MRFLPLLLWAEPGLCDKGQFDYFSTIRSLAFRFRIPVCFCNSPRMAFRAMGVARGCVPRATLRFALG